MGVGEWGGGNTLIEAWGEGRVGAYKGGGPGKGDNI